MLDNGLPCLDMLEATPSILRGLMCEVRDDDARWKPAPDRFSIAEVLAHLSHSEGHCYRARLDRFIAENRPEFEPDDAQMYLDLYRDADPEDSFDHFEEQRETNLEFLRGLPPGSGNRGATHREAGEITLAQMLHEWALHDLGHIRQIAELVRARKYLAGAGLHGEVVPITPMIIRCLAIGLCCAGALASQTFIQMSDPQFGMYTKNQGFDHETANFELAIATANRLHPAFLVVTGDLINEAGNAAQAAEFHRIAAKLNPQIRLFNVPGNHDVGNEPTPQSLEAYRQRFGADYYTFRVGEIAGFVLNSNLEKATQNVPEEAAKMERWLATELAKARRDGVKHLIVYQHISFFLADAEEEDQYFNIPRETRRRYLKILHEYGVKQVFAGHYHRNAWGLDGDLEMVTTGPVGMPLGGGKSGLRVVTVSDSGVTHSYYDFGDLP